jgi:hypothetical protein
MPPHRVPQVKACRPLGNGVRASAEMSAMPDRLRLITPGGIPAPPEAAAQLLADVGVSRNDLRYRVGSSVLVVERSGKNESHAAATQGSGHWASEGTPTAAVQEPLRAGGRALNPARASRPHGPITPLEPLPPSPNESAADGATGADGSWQQHALSRLGRQVEPRDDQAC